MSVHREALRAAAGCFAFAAACSLTSNVDDFGPGAATSVGAGSTSSTAVGGSGGGGLAACGNGLIDPDEECDDRNDVANDGCADCLVECVGEDVVLKDRTTFHCYRIVATILAWQAGRAACQGYGPGYDLAAFSTAAEYAAVSEVFPLLATFEKTAAWVGANDLETEGMFIWSNGEPWWPELPLSVSDTDGTEDCAIVDPAGVVKDTPCGQTTVSLCEGAPVSVP